MKATSGLSTRAFLPSTTTSNADGGAATPPPGEKSSSTFSDVLKNQEAAPSRTGSAGTSPSSNATPTPPADATPMISEINPAPVSPAGPVAPAAPAAISAPAKLPTSPTAPSADQDENVFASSSHPAATPYLASSLTQAAVLKANARTTNANDPDADTTTSATVIAPTLTAVKELPFFKSSPKAIGTSASEKKSASSGMEGSFLQAGTPANAGTWFAYALGQGQLSPVAQNVEGKPTTSAQNSATGALDGLAADAANGAGTANGKKEEDMSATLELPQTITSIGTNPLVTKTPADVHILLSTNHDFKEALGQVMRVAEMSGMSKTTPPLRVAIEIQTPPGAVVNVYVSRQTDGYRAQLSANDPAALSWVQDQIGSLRQTTDEAVPVRWLPAQMESTTPAAAPVATSSGRDAGLSWDRGGQNQQGWRQSGEERPPRQKRAALPVFATARANPFLSPVGALGRAA